MIITTELKRQIDLVDWINTNLACSYDLSDRNKQLSHTCFDLAIEHHAAMCMLAESKLYGSMYSLLRIEFEALVKGLWLRYVASDGDIVKFEKDNVKMTFGAVVDSIESKFGMSSGVLSVVKSRQWKIFNSFTHNGYQALLRRVNDTHTGPVNYTEPEIISALRHAGLFAILSAVELSSLTENQKLIDEAMNIARDYGE